SVIQKAAHENANIIFGAVMDDAMKDSIKITVIAAGFKEAGKKNSAERPAYLPKTWKAGRDENTQAAAAGAGASSAVQSSAVASTAIAPQSNTVAASSVVQQVKENVREVQESRERREPVREAAPAPAADDLDVPTFLRRQVKNA